MVRRWHRSGDVAQVVERQVQCVADAVQLPGATRIFFSKVSFQRWLSFRCSCRPCVRVHALTYVCTLKIPITGCTKTQHAVGQFSKAEHGQLSGRGIGSGPIHSSLPQKWLPYLRKKRGAEEEEVTVTLLRPAAERASCRAHKLHHTGRIPTTSAFIVLAVADGLFGLCG